MAKINYEYIHKSFIEKGEIYFLTATINGWQKLLLENRFKRGKGIFVY